MSMHYSNTSTPLPDVEVFFQPDGTLFTKEGKPLPEGWYWRASSPGRLPDGEPSGPFPTHSQALARAREWPHAADRIRTVDFPDYRHSFRVNLTTGEVRTSTGLRVVGDTASILWSAVARIQIAQDLIAQVAKTAAEPDR